MQKENLIESEIEAPTYIHQVFGEEGVFKTDGCADTCIFYSEHLTLDLDSNYFNDLSIIVQEGSPRCDSWLDTIVWAEQTVTLVSKSYPYLYFFADSSGSVFYLQKGQIIGDSIESAYIYLYNGTTQKMYRRRSCSIYASAGSPGNKYVGLKIQRLDGALYGWLNLELKIDTPYYSPMELYVKEYYMGLIPNKPVIVGEAKFHE